MRFTTVSLLLLAWAQPAPADIIHVYEGESIQAAIDGCASGDEIIVHPGTYYESIDFLGKAIWLHSADGPELTIIDNDGADWVVQCISGEGPDTVLQGFTITDVYLPGSAGGMYNWYSSPTVIDCRFSDHWRLHCGGMFNDHSHPAVANCIFSDNRSYFSGGGMDNHVSDPIVVDCLFTGNVAWTWGSYGGGMCNTESSPIVCNCSFIDNQVDGGGGGMANGGSSPLVMNCTFAGNQAVGGGGMLNDNSTPTVTNCTFSGNTAGYGGALSNALCSPAVTNCILWDGGWEISGNATVTYSNVQGGYPGEGNIDVDPLFVDPEGGDYRLSPGSPCIDAGHNWGVPMDEGDFDGDGNTCELFPVDLAGAPRFVNDPAAPDAGCGLPVIVDMGAYEFQVPGAPPIEILFGDVNGDGVVDVLDLLAVIGAWGPAPGCTLADLDMNGAVDVPDLLRNLAAWGPCD